MMNTEIRIILICVTFIILLFQFDNVAGEEKPPQGGGLNRFMNAYCGNPEFLNTIKKSKKECNELFIKHSKECKKPIEGLEILLEEKLEGKDYFMVFKDISAFYFMCIKSSVYEEAFSIPIL